MLLFLFFNFRLILFNCRSYCTNFDTIAELVVPIGMSSSEAPAETEIHPVTTETQI